jgi:hypothetical protein
MRLVNGDGTSPISRKSVNAAAIGRGIAFRWGYGNVRRALPLPWGTRNGERP